MASITYASLIANSFLCYLFNCSDPIADHRILIIVVKCYIPKANLSTIVLKEILLKKCYLTGFQLRTGKKPDEHK